jgi:hypothetical protein
LQSICLGRQSRDKFKKIFSLKSIGEAFFSLDSNLKKVYLPESVEELGEDLFRACTSLTVIAPAGSYAEEYARDYYYTKEKGFADGVEITIQNP